MMMSVLLRILWVALLGMAHAAHAQEARFDVFEYRVEGTTLLTQALIEQAVYPHLGEQKTIRDVEAAREALEQAYHATGYLTVLVSIPQQKVDAGVVRLVVTEAPVDRLRVVESRYYSLGQIKAGAPELAEGRVPNFAQLQEELAVLNRSADRRITPVLRPGRTPGTVEVDLKVEDRLPLHGSVELNNRYSQDTTPTRLNASLRWDNLWGRQHGLGLAVQTVPAQPDESRVISLNYSWPLASGDYLAFYGVKSDSNIAAVGTLNVVGKGEIYGARYIRPLRGAEDFFHTATFGVDYKDINQTVILVDSGGFDTPINYMPMTLGWDGSWQARERTSKLGVAFNFHLRGMTGSEQQFADKRYKGRPGYSYLRGTAAHTETLDGGWGLQARASWQYTGQPLISNEQFVIGGADTVRAYLESAALGDTGYAFSLEARTPNVGKQLGEALDDAHLLAFHDKGLVRVIEPITAESRYSLSSYGLGLRAKGWGGASLALDWAVALQDMGKTRKGDARWSFRLAYEW